MTKYIINFIQEIQNEGWFEYKNNYKRMWFSDFDER